MIRYGDKVFEETPVCLHIVAVTLLSNQGILDGKSKQINKETHRDDRIREAKDKMDEQRRRGINETCSTASKGMER